MKKPFKSCEPIAQISTEEQKRQANLRRAQVEESLVKLSHKEEAVIEEETFPLFNHPTPAGKVKSSARRTIPACTWQYCLCGI